MSDDETVCPSLLIEPEPTPLELVAIMASLRPTREPETENQPISKWAEIARREQIRLPLDDRRTGWNR
ncbi:MAG: hypothetical protein IT339_03150 [Thermomicrobiales bacterium]|nr:hypothetical protein [Thermomicrobiales bacterium]